MCFERDDVWLSLKFHNNLTSAAGPFYCPSSSQVWTPHHHNRIASAKRRGDELQEPVSDIGEKPSSQNTANRAEKGSERQRRPCALDRKRDSRCNDQHCREDVARPGSLEKRRAHNGLTFRVSDRRQPPLTSDLSLSETAASRSLHRQIRFF